MLRSNVDLFEPEVKARCHVLKLDAWRPPPLTPAGEEQEVPPDLIFLDPPYKVVTEDATKAAYAVRQLLARLAPGGVICFHFQDGQLDRDDFDADLDVDIRRWGRSVVAIMRRAADALLTDTSY